MQLEATFSPAEIRSKIGDDSFAFLFHATDWDTLSFGLKKQPERSQDIYEALWTFGPVITSEITLSGRTVGITVVSPVTPDLWLTSSHSRRRFRDTQYLPALGLIKSCGIRNVALGALMPHVCDFGRFKGDYGDIAITTGHASTVATLLQVMQDCCDHTQTEYEKMTLAIFGSAGMMGRQLLSAIRRHLPRKLILIDIPMSMPFVFQQAASLGQNQNVEVHSFTSAEQLPDFDGAILLTNQTEAFLTADTLRRASFWIDDSHPRAASFEAESQSREQTVYVECYTRGPDGFATNFPFRLPSQRDCYSCLAEGFILGASDMSPIVGQATEHDIWNLKDLLPKHGFAAGPLTGKDGTIIVPKRQNTVNHTSNAN